MTTFIEEHVDKDGNPVSVIIGEVQLDDDPEADAEVKAKVDAAIKRIFG